MIPVTSATSPFLPQHRDDVTRVPPWRQRQRSDVGGRLSSANQRRGAGGAAVQRGGGGGRRASHPPPAPPPRAEGSGSGPGLAARAHRAGAAPPRRPISDEEPRGLPGDSGEKRRAPRDYNPRRAPRERLPPPQRTTAPGVLRAQPGRELASLRAPRPPRAARPLPAATDGSSTARSSAQKFLFVQQSRTRQTQRGGEGHAGPAHPSRPEARGCEEQTLAPSRAVEDRPTLYST